MTGIQIVFPSLRSTNADPKHWNLILDGQAKPNPANKTHSENKFWIIMIRVGVQGMNTLYVNNWFLQVKNHWTKIKYTCHLYTIVIYIYIQYTYIHTQIIPVSCWTSKSSITWYWFNLNNHFCPRHTCLVLTHSGFNANPAGFVGAKLGRLSGKPNMPHRLQREVFMNINGFLHTSCDSRFHSF